MNPLLILLFVLLLSSDSEHTRGIHENQTTTNSSRRLGLASRDDLNAIALYLGDHGVGPQANWVAVANVKFMMFLRGLWLSLLLLASSM